MLKLYGVVLSRANRCIWMLEEAGLSYELVKTTAHPDDLRTHEYLRLNPTARMPTLVDGEFVVWESLAINPYLADKYEGPLHAGSPEVRAQAAQWSIFAVLELESLARDLLDHRLNLAERAREASIAERSKLLLQRPIGVIEAVLCDRAYLLGESFTVADLNVASILSWAKRGQLDFSPFPNVERWLELCFGRPAYLKLRERMMAELNS